MNSRYYLTEVDKFSRSIYFFLNLNGESLIEPHSHKKGQFLYAEGGVVHVKTNDKMHYLPAKHYMWIPPGVRHSIYPSSATIVMKNIYFPVSINASDFYKNVGIYPINSLLLEMLSFTKNWSGDIEKTLKNEYAIAKAFKAILETSASKSLHLDLPHPKDNRLIKITKYISDHIQQEHLLPKLAKSFSMTEKSLYRLFKKDLKMSFIQYYTHLRIYKSLEYLMNFNYNISEIAGMVGYNSLPAFSNSFIKITGKRPSEYRKSNEIFKEVKSIL